MPVTVSPYKIGGTNSLSQRMIKAAAEIIRDRLEAVGLSGNWPATVTHQIRMQSPEPFRATRASHGRVYAKVRPGDNSTAWEWALTPPDDVDAEEACRRLKGEQLEEPSSESEPPVDRNVAGELAARSVAVFEPLPPGSPPSAQLIGGRLVRESPEMQRVAAAASPAFPRLPEATAAAEPPAEPAVSPAMALGALQAVGRVSREEASLRLLKLYEESAAYVEQASQLEELRERLQAKLEEAEQLDQQLRGLEQRLQAESPAKRAWERLQALQRLLEGGPGD